MMKINNDLILNELKKIAPLNGKTICVAFSGGADSVYLLRKLNEFSSVFKFKLIAAHINHHLRGAESDRDALFCMEVCKELAVPLKVFNINVLASSDKKESVEEAARRLRYNALLSIDCDFIATAHHLDDNAETVLINMIRGSGLKGFCGIPNNRGNIIRPLLEVSKEDILKECEMFGWKFVTDSTNNSDDYTRNLLRHKVLPVLKKINPSFNRVLSRNIKLLKTDNDYLESVSERLYNVSKHKNGLNTELLKNEHLAVLSRVVKKYCSDVSNISADMKHIEEFVRIIRDGKGRYELSNGYIASVKNDLFVLENRVQKEFSVAFEVIEEKNINNYLKINNLLLKNTIDYDKICGEFVVRTRQSGDKFSPLGRGITKSLRRLQQEKNIPVYLRDVFPVAADEKGVFWAYNIGIAQRVSADLSTKKLLVFSVVEN